MTDKQMTRAQKDLLAPWATAWAELHTRIWDWVNDADDDHVAALLDAAQATSQTNCWWATYEVAEEVKKAARGRALRREHGEARP